MRLPVGYDNFQEVVKKKLDFIDKTLFIKAVLDDDTTKVAVITRPRRFGKTFNLSMLQHFLSQKVNGKETRGLFKHLKIAQCGNTYMQHQGKYPVISITFKDIKGPDYNSAKLHLSKKLSVLYSNYIELLDSKKLSAQDKRDFKKILEKKGDEIDLKESIKDLTRYIYIQQGIKPWLLIDEYDTPIQAAYSREYYDEMIDLMRGLFGASLKSNDYLEKSVVTGILRIAKESLFSEVNNLKVYSMLSSRYSEYFGFTEDEVNAILEKSSLLPKLQEIKHWYNGYTIGDTVIYNPWSIVNCIDEKGKLKPYWVNTSDNQLIKNLLKKSSLEFKHQFEFLVSGKCIEKLIDEHMVLQYLKNNISSVWSLLLMSGYLKAVSLRETDQGTFAQLAIPNREVLNLYRQIVEEWLSNGYGIEWYNDFIHSLLNGNMEDFKKHLEKVILQITSYHDFVKEPEVFYHGLILGFTASLHSVGTYEIKSNRESGLGRFDIMLTPKDTSKYGIIIELKSTNKKEDLLIISQEAVKQIGQKKYIEELKNSEIKDVIKIGIAFCGKEFEIYSDRENLKQQKSNNPEEH